MADVMEDSRLYNAEAIAKLIGASANHVRDLARESKIPVIRLGEGPRAPMRFVPSEVLAALRELGAKD